MTEYRQVYLVFSAETLCTSYYYTARTLDRFGRGEAYCRYQAGYLRLFDSKTLSFTNNSIEDYSGCP